MRAAGIAVPDEIALPHEGGPPGPGLAVEVTVEVDATEAIETLLSATQASELVTDSVLSFAALLAATAESLNSGDIALTSPMADLAFDVESGQWDQACTQLQWSCLPNRTQRRNLEQSIGEFITTLPKDADARNLPSAELFEFLWAYAMAATDSLARSFPIPSALVGPCADPVIADQIKRWSHRAVMRNQTQSRLGISLHAPPVPGAGWVADVGLITVRDDNFWPVPPLVLDRNQLATDLGLNPESLADLLSAELAAARGAARFPRLYTELSAVLDETRLVKFCDAIDAWEAVGIEVRTPKGTLRKRRMRTSASISGTPTGMVSGGLELTVAAAIDGKTLSPAEIEELINSSTQFVKLGSDWVRVPSGTGTAARLIERANRGDLLATDILSEEFDGLEVDATGVKGWVGEALRGITSLTSIAQVSVAPELQADLRHYQLDGLAWLTWCEANNVGGILADDMGLGKTIQILARIQADHAGPTLVVCPTTLLDNWRREAAKFTPDLRLSIHHGSGRDLSQIIDHSDIVVTTYAVMAKDSDIIDTAWHRVVLDEAQAIKNPSSKAAQRARMISATHRFAVTGTPVENHLGDLWSLMAFAQPGLLGSFAAFRRRYLSNAASDDPTRIERLRNVVGPFMLRRRKSDKTVVPDLPPKIEIRRDCSLTREQAGIYQTTARKMIEAVESSDGTARRGMILAGLTKLKQACVHPQLAMGTHSKGLTSSSGKLVELESILTETVAEGDAVIVFSQYASFLRPLAAYLNSHAGIDSLVLHGSMTRHARTRVVDQFSAASGPPVLLASLKAGGTGLNLVRASHVIHLDRWWNPAVEDQGSDRAWRIGQTQTVMVHTLVCPGTLEDRIDQVLSHKRDTAAAIVEGNATKAVTELSTSELAELVALVGKESDTSGPSVVEVRP